MTVWNTLRKNIGLGADMHFDWGVPAVKGRKMHFNPKPVIPHTGWVRPKNLPDLGSAEIISIDTETYDPNLKERGPGWSRGDGEIVGLAVATDDGFKAYYPVRHQEDPHLNFPPDEVFDWARIQLGRSHQPKVGHNLIYDLGFLLEEKVEVVGELWDTWIAEKLIHHRQDASLEATGQRRVGRGKKATLLLRWLFQYFGRGRMPENDEDLDETFKGMIYKAPPSLAGPYAEEDVLLPMEIADVQYRILEEMELMAVFELETQLIPLLVRMRMEGVTVDVKGAEQADVRLTSEIITLQREIDHEVGHHLEVNSGDKVGLFFATQGIELPKTAKTHKYSVTEEILKKVEHPVAEKIIDLKELMKFQSTFVRGYILDSAVKGKIHAQFNQMQAITGRFSSSQPNLTNIPSRNEELMRVIRGIFVPDIGHDHFRKYDYSQIECRVLAHFATGRGAQELRDEYNADPKTNYHRLSHKMILEKAGVDLPHKKVKQCGFAIFYGGGQSKLARLIGLSKEETEPFFEAFHSGLPYVRDTMDSISRETAARGHTLTVLGRRVQFDLWEPKFTHLSERLAVPLDKAVKLWGSNIQRAYLYKSLNYVVQGSAADQLKTAMLKCYQAGIYDVTGIPKGVIHDEKIFSCRDDSPATNEAFREMKYLMENAIQFRVPILVSSERGTSWGTTTEFDT